MGGPGPAHSSPSSPSTAYTPKQRVSLTLRSNIRPEAALQLDEAAFSHEFLFKNGVRAPLLNAAGITATQLRAHGTDSPAKLASLGYTSLSLTRPGFCDELIRLYGASDVVDAFLETPEDAVNLAGESCLSQLNLTTASLLLVCAATPDAAIRVIKSADSLAGVPPETLILTGVSAKQLKAEGHTTETVKSQTGANGLDILRLGFLNE